MALVGLTALGLGLGAAQPPMLGRVKHFSVPEYFDPPHQNQVKTLLTGEEAQPQAAGMFLLKGVKLELYRLTGERELWIESPECVYDSAQRIASSSRRLEVQTGDGQIAIAGEGFLWRQTNASLIISNRVHTVIRRGPPPSTP